MVLYVVERAAFVYTSCSFKNKMANVPSPPNHGLTESNENPAKLEFAMSLESVNFQMNKRIDHLCSHH